MWAPRLAGLDVDHARSVLGELSEPDRRVLARCSLVDRFDGRMFAELCAVDGGAALAELVRGDLVVRLPGGDDVHQVPPGLRQAAWSSWFSGGVPPEDAEVPGPLREFAERLAAYCVAPTLAPDRLRALLLADPARAAEVFETEFTACADKLDLAGCRNLLDVLADPAYRPFVPPRLTELRRARKREVHAREIWRTAFLDSTRYLFRPELEAHLAEVLAPDGPRALRLQGSGGNGKSTLLKRFIAHRCVRTAVPCALLDLDLVDPVNATRHPFLALLEIADQLNGQMAGAPFEELLRDHGTYRTLLTKQPEELDASTPASLDRPASKVDEEDVLFRFGSILADVSGAEPILIVVDTFEEAALRPAGDADNLIATLAKLQDDGPAVRLVLSGRHTRAEDDLVCLRERLTPEVMPRRTVDAFTSDESAAYLRSVRGITRRDLITPIVERAGGMPWQLAVLADVVDNYPTVTGALLATLDPGVAWAIDRVIGHIHDTDVQWLVRYGAVPRYLSRDFAIKVIVPRIRQSMAGSPDDDPERDPVPPDSAKVFRTGGQPRLDGDELWRSLTRFAATTSWMSIAPSNADAVVFHPSVRGPMRRLVAAQPVGALLHADAVRHYEDLATADAAGWATWTAEALYHRFQLSGPAAGPAWDEAMTQARDRDRLDWVATIAGEILGPEYVNDEGRPRQHPSGQPVVDAGLVAAAHVERAWALAQLARQQGLPGGHAMWSQVETSLGAAQRAPSAPARGDRFGLARAALRLARGESAAAADELESVDGELATADRHSLLMLLADAREAQGQDDRAAEARRQAWTVATSHPAPLALLADTARARAEEPLARGAVDVAARLAHDAVVEVPRLVTDRGFGRLLTRIELAAGRPESALGHARTARYVIGQVDALTVLGRPHDAIARCADLLGRRPVPGLRAALLVRRGLAHASVLDVDRALVDLVEARKVYFRLSDSEGAGATCAYAARVVVDVVGNLRDAEHHLDEADRLLLRNGSRAWVDCRLMRAELITRVNEDGDPARPARAALNAVTRPGDPRDRDSRRIVDAALRALVWAPALESAALETLLAWLPRITPASARLVALTALADCPAKTWGERLIGAVNATPAGGMPGQPSELDQAWLGLRRAELSRVAGYPHVAVTNADGSGRELAATAGFGEWMRLAAVHRATKQVPVPVASPAAPPAFGSPLLSAAYTLTRADLLVETGSAASVEELLSSAEADLDRATPRTSRWRFLQCDLRRRLATRRRDDDQAEHWRLTGDAVLAELGQRRQPANAVIAEEAAKFRKEVRLEVGLDTEGALVVWSDVWQLLRLELDHPLVAALAQENDRRAKSPVVRWVRDAVRDDVLLDLPVPLVVRDAPADLRICADPPLAQLPWELVTIAGQPVTGQPSVRLAYRSMVSPPRGQVAGRVLQEALYDAGAKPGPLDGYVGPQTERAVRGVQRARGLIVDGAAGPKTWRELRSMTTTDRRRPAAIVVQRSFVFEAAAERGYSASGGRGLADLYAQAGWRSCALAGYDLGHIDEVMPEVRFDVLHVNASIDVSGSVPYLDFGASPMGWSADRSDSVPVSDLDQAVHRLASRGHTPLVVLDIATPPKFTSETIRQLLLRNDYAHQLLALGRTHSVLATGLVTKSPATMVQEELVRVLVSADTPAGAIRTLHRTSTHFRTDALFTALRPDLMPRLSPERAES